jgi:hypothetical protein
MKDRKIIIVDLDHTLFDETERQQRWTGGSPYTAEYYAGLINDPPIKKHIEWVKELWMQDRYIIALTARNEICREETEQQLKRAKVPYHRLLMRCKDDNRRGFQTKKDELLKLPLEQIEFCIEDNPLVIDMMLDLGLKVYDAKNKKWAEKTT